MKVLYVTTISGTINAFLVPHIKMLLKQGHNVDIACNITSPINEQLLEHGCRVYNIEFQRSPLTRKNYIAYKKLKNLIQEGDYDLVHTHTPVASFITRLVCKDISNIKVFYTAHGFHFLKGAPVKNWLLYYPMEKVAAKWTDGLITINEEDYQVAKKWNLIALYKTHGVGVNLTKFTPQNKEIKNKLREEYQFQKDDFILIYAANLNENKHQTLLINTIKILKNDVPNLKLLLAGDGPLRETYKKQIKEEQLEENIILLGIRKDIPKLLQISDVAVASSKREGLPVNLMEAMATGLPLVATERRGHNDLITHGENGFLIGVNNIDGFSKAIRKLYESKELRWKFGRNNIRFVQKYKLDNVLAELNDIYSNYFR
ncbi:glycosyltransferase family 4 protein [Fictibacillus sp. NPDC058756]|uniref:glycosyltransferase family 4 protein n=1 Tax=Fictibacillus sp. NPDC058756 TaxID=3346625 RepID=UPI0036CD0E56